MDRRHPARLIRHAAQRTCRRSMWTATAALGTTMSRPSSLAGSHRVSLPISSQGAAKDCALSLTWSGRAAVMPAFLGDSIVRGLSGDFQKTPLSQTSAVGALPPVRVRAPRGRIQPRAVPTEVSRCPPRKPFRPLHGQKIGRRQLRVAASIVRLTLCHIFCVRARLTARASIHKALSSVGG
jgi:hypothetical protein